MEIVFQRKETFKLVNAGTSYWNHRITLAKDKENIARLFKAVDHPGDLFLCQWAQLMSMTLEFEPDLVLELGRGRGNSTCAFTEAIHLINSGNRQVVSLCLSDDWDKLTKPRVSQVVPSSWFSPLQTLQTDILSFDYQLLLSEKRKILIFWDAHGFEVAECVLGRILPLVAAKPHWVIMHDLSDTRSTEGNRFYGENGLWKGNNWSGPRLRIGNIDSAVEQAIAAIDFTTRNKLNLFSADEAIREEIGNDPQKLSEIRRILGDDMFSMAAHWFYFSLNEREGTFTFPKPGPVNKALIGAKNPVPAEQASLLGKVKNKIRSVLKPW
ncbi:MAG: hypothetical protein A3C47_00580 [Omnitrophica bacterium RIFCSPHIGHO2_02_FULL_51_18]|nr:MAG: hypothetical protein A3C47_00580 [Omnitrophica bacterium RIFCSPHIGHO2_02_FULL_51_18]